ncbi:MAG: nucleoside hydrolase [Armatimonadota bacterium]|nr:nucleoside hydrolase [Armatimonadota bacterium]MDW8142742.1 nucleoside hydrolase [Armatimonadota bacterium]
MRRKDGFASDGMAYRFDKQILDNEVVVSGMAVKLFVDTDIGSNVDDAFALALAAILPDVELVGVTTVGSMVAVRAQLARKILTTIGKRGIPVSAGCAQGLVEPPSRSIPEQSLVLDEVDKLFFPPANGVDFLRDAVRRHPGDLVIVTLGAMTNLALALRAEPALYRLIRKVVMMAGTESSHYAETNVRNDPEAAYIVFNSGIPFVMVPKDITQQAIMPVDLMKRLMAGESPLCKLLWEMTKIWLQATGASAPTLNDPLAVAIAAKPELARIERVRVEVELHGAHTRGHTIVIPEPTGPGWIVRSVNWEGFWSLLENILFA